MSESSVFVDIVYFYKQFMIRIDLQCFAQKKLVPKIELNVAFSSNLVFSLENEYES